MPTPRNGYNEEPVSYDVQFPGAKVISVPRFLLNNVSVATLKFGSSMIPGEPFAVAGEFSVDHPGETTGAPMRIVSRPARGKGAAFDKIQGGGIAKAKDGLLRYRIESRAPTRSGSYEISVFVDHPPFDSAPGDEVKFVSTLVATGELMIQRKTR